MNTSQFDSKKLFELSEDFRVSYRIARWIPDRLQRQLLTSFFAFTVVSGIVYYGSRQVTAIDFPGWLPEVVAIVGAVSLLIMLFVLAIRSFYLFYRLATPVANPATDAPSWRVMSFPAAATLLEIQSVGDLATGFILSPFGQEVCQRAGVHPKTLHETLPDSGSPGMAGLDIQPPITLHGLTTAILQADQRLQEAFLSAGITQDVVEKAARWVERTDRQFRRETRFWSAENLQAIKPLAQDFAYGNVYTLEKFAKPAGRDAVFLGAGTTDSAFERDIEAVFNILSRPRDANVLLVGSASGGIGDIIAAVSARFKAGDGPETLGDRQLYTLDTQALITAAEGQGAGQLERTLEKLLVEATTAGNVLLVIKDIVRFRDSANQLGVDIFSILDTFLDHPELPIVATTAVNDYHQSLEGREVMSHFGAVQVHDVDDDTLLKLLGEVAVAREGEAICTVGGLEAIARAGRNLITDDEMPHSAVNLLLEILSAHPSARIDTDLVEAYVSERTGVPTGSVTDEERAELSNLESKLHERIVGQDEAVKAIASALRRNRSGVEEQDRPIGTFLFLGPTGVGKTETAKTLDQVYFEGGGMRRLDMSEYSQPDAIDRLRGASGQSGRLSNIVREQPYGVLLLDEFEKASSAVHDLFLQILDEGHFSDGAGRRVSLDNMIIIATSNAGADTIFSLVEEGVDLQSEKDNIIDKLISQGEFRPELLNRFDGTILYHPLSSEDLRAVTRLLFGELKGRLKRRGFRLELADDVTDFVVEHGYNPEFGARAIRRVIQDTVENVIADKIIDEGLSAGDEIYLSAADIKAAV